MGWIKRRIKNILKTVIAFCLYLLDGNYNKKELIDSSALYTRKNKYHTDHIYIDREQKSEYIWLKYQQIIQGKKILDVGADEKYLKKHLEPGNEYWGIGLGGNPDQVVDLEIDKIPFPDNSFDLVLCFDVLEHLENIHEIFDECCRTTKEYFIFSLPNPLISLFNSLEKKFKHAPEGTLVRFYGLPHEYPEDRHKWFFTFSEAVSFIEYRSKKNQMQIVQIDTNIQNYKMEKTLMHNLLYSNIELDRVNLRSSNLWAVLKKNHI